MAPIFASPDIAALVSAFPPPLPVRERPSLVRSQSGNNVLDSRKVLARFRILLETSPARIRKADLPSKLGIEKAEWIYDCYDGELYYSKDLQSLIPEKEVHDILEGLRGRAREDFVELPAFASENDMSRQSCDRLLHACGLRWFTLADGGQIVGAETLADGLQQQIQSDIANTSGERIDMTSLHAPIPESVLLALAGEVLEKQDGEGSLAKEGERVVYTPSNYQSLQDKKQQELRASKIAAALNDLSIDGFCDVESEATNSQTQGAKQSMVTEITAKFRDDHGDVQLMTMDQSSGDSNSVVVIAKESSVDEVMKELHEILTNLAKTRRQADRTLPSLTALETDLCDETTYPGLTRRLLRSKEHRKMLEMTLTSVIRAAEGVESDEFTEICQSTLLGPIELYQRGLQTVPDQSLNERLNVYICEHFRNDTVPALAREVEKAGLLHDKARAKEMEKLTAACAQTKTVTDLQSAASKFSRKMKLPAPDATQLSDMKREILRQRLKDLQKTTRGSDVLINLIWILLAQQSDGLLMSAGKDTSRMIKHFQSIGDAEKGQRLQQWRDLLKADKQSHEDVQQMKAMADEAVAGMFGESVTQTDG